MGMSRNEDILQAMVDGGDSSAFLPARSREEDLLIQILDKMSGGGGGISIHICSVDEYNPYTLVPTVSNPDSTTFYLVPSASVGTDIYDEWVYVNYGWEKFGSGGTVVSYLSSMNDVDIYNPGDGQALTYDAVQRKWTNTSNIPASASIDENGLISWKNNVGTVLFTLQLPAYALEESE